MNAILILVSSRAPQPRKVWTDSPTVFDQMTQKAVMAQTDNDASFHVIIGRMRICPTSPANEGSSV
jgi:hypothetical protein